MKFRKEDKRIFLTLAKGDYINHTFQVFAEVEGIGSAWLNGIGALKDPEIGYYSIGEKKYHRKQFFGEFELTSLIGNITWEKDKPFSHTHITFSDPDYHVFGGHLFDAKISAAGEFIMHYGTNKISRKVNSSIGLPLWCLEESID
jgi:predicted DNA-binding protein with PD1-like motif